MESKRQKHLAYVLGFALVGLILLVFSLQEVVGATAVAGTANDETRRTFIRKDREAISATAANCRYGATPIDTQAQPEQVNFLPLLGAGWYMTFLPYEPDNPPATNPEFVHVIFPSQDKTEDGQYLQSYSTRPPLNQALANYIKARPNSIWVIGNEVDRGPQPGFTVGGQGDMFPNMYAEAYHDIYHFIKAANPTARVAVSPLVQVTPGRLQYLDLMWEAYLQKYGSPMPVDVWNMHLYILPEVEPDGFTPNNIANVALGTDPLLGKRVSTGPQDCPQDEVYCFAEHDDMDVFAEQVVAMRTWMKERGQQNKPLILTEFSLLYPYEQDVGSCFLMDENGECFTPTRVATFMQNAFNYLNDARSPQLGYLLDDNRLVQQWMWFSIYTNAEGSASNLATADLRQMTLMGETFRDYVFNETPYRNLIVEKASTGAVFTNGAPTADAEISVTFRNNGNTAVTDPFLVTFYTDAGLTTPIASTVINPLVRGCATQPFTASVTWSGLTPGAHRFWVRLDNSDIVAEVPTGNVDNVASGIVYVDPERIMLPMVRR